jgi:hypothetical protein
MRKLASWIERNLTMTQEALAQGLNLQAPLGGHAAAVAMRVSLDNEAAFCPIGTTAPSLSLTDVQAAWPQFGNRPKEDCLNAIYGAVLGGMAHGPGFNFWTGIFDDGHSSPADVNPGLTNATEAEAMLRSNKWTADLPANGMQGFQPRASTDAGTLTRSADLAGLADWSISHEQGSDGQGSLHSGADVFMI